MKTDLSSNIFFLHPWIISHKPELSTVLNYCQSNRPKNPMIVLQPNSIPQWHRVPVAQAYFFNFISYNLYPHILYFSYPFPSPWLLHTQFPNPGKSPPLTPTDSYITRFLREKYLLNAINQLTMNFGNVAYLFHRKIYILNISFVISVIWLLFKS